MSKLGEALRKIRRGETGRQIGFGAVSTPKRRALLLGVFAGTADQVRTALDAGAEVVLIRGTDEWGARAAAEASAGTRAVVGARLDGLDVETAAALRDAGVDFVVAPLDRVAATASVNGSPGVVGVIDIGIDDSELRSVALLELDGALVDGPTTGLTLAQQARLARISTGAGVPLLVACPADVAADELRVLRDAGTGAVIVPEGTAPDAIAELAKRLETVQPRKAAEREIALLPSVERHYHDEEEEEEYE